MLEQFQHAWRSQDHRRKGDLRQELDSLLIEINRERRRSRIVLAICGAYTVGTTIAIGIIFSQRPAPVSEVWPLVVAQLAAIVVLGGLLRSRYLEERAGAGQGASVKETLMLALRSTESEMRSAKLVGISMAAVVTLSVVGMANLYQSGKMDEKAISSLGSVLALIVAFNALLLWRKLTQRYGPRRQRLRAILYDLQP